MQKKARKTKLKKIKTGCHWRSIQPWRFSPLISDVCHRKIQRLKYLRFCQKAVTTISLQMLQVSEPGADKTKENTLTCCE